MVSKAQVVIDGEEKLVKLKRLEKKKLRVINRLIAGEINGPKAAKLSSTYYIEFFHK